jgi:hypothetical protein
VSGFTVRIHRFGVLTPLVHEEQLPRVFKLCIFACVEIESILVIVLEAVDFCNASVLLQSLWKDRMTDERSKPTSEDPLSPPDHVK